MVITSQKWTKFLSYMKIQPKISKNNKKIKEYNKWKLKLCKKLKEIRN